MLLFGGLAEHIVAEFSSKVTSADVETSIWDTVQIKSIKNSIRLLISASGDVLSDKNARDDTIYDMLESYRSGTQRAKEWNRPNGRPKEDELGCICDMNFKSPEMKAKEMLNKIKGRQVPDVRKDVVLFDPNYSRVDGLLKIAGSKYNCSECIGFRLVDYRKEKDKQQQCEDNFQ